MLRKAAILNKIRRDAMKAKEEQERAVEEARRQFRFASPLLLLTENCGEGSDDFC